MKKEETKAEESKKPISVFVSGLPYTIKDEEVKPFFGDLGKKITKITLPRYQDSGRAIGYAHVEFEDQESFDKALRMTGKKIGARYVEIQPSKGRGQKQLAHAGTKPPEDCHNVFVKGLPYQITEEKVGELFAPCGSIVAIRFVHNSVTKVFKGFCYIEFDNPASVAKAIKMSGREVDGRTISVDYDVGQPKKGYKCKSEDVTKHNQKVKEQLDQKRTKQGDEGENDEGPQRKTKKVDESA